MTGQETGGGTGAPGLVETEDARDLRVQAAFHAARGEQSQALRCYEMALLVDEGNAQTWFDYASLQRRMGLLEDAAESFEFALRQDPRMYAARFSAAQLMVELGRPLVALSHFAPVDDTLVGEPKEIWPFLGNYRLGEAIDETGVDLAVHGHAHAGREKGLTPAGVPVRNVAQPVIQAAFRVYDVVPRRSA